MARKDKELEKLLQKVTCKDETEFLKYLIDCCENILENPNIMKPAMAYGISPIVLQLIKIRAEVTQRLENNYSIKYGKFASRTHLLGPEGKWKLS
jgi:hypothetical protein